MASKEEVGGENKAGETVRKLLRIAPHPEENGDGYLPSSLARWMTVDSTTDYHPLEYPAYKGTKKVLVVCTEECYFEMLNGKKFRTGNHPVEVMLPLMHFQQAGIEYDICTPTGAPVAMEMWAMPERDFHIQDFFKSNHGRFQTPKALAGIVYNLASAQKEYCAIFIPGGQHLPKNISDSAWELVLIELK